MQAPVLRKGNTKSIVLAAARAIGAQVLAERANPGAIGSPGLLDVAVVQARVSIAAVTSDEGW